MIDASSSYDVAVLGGGPAGSAAAIELAKHGQRVIVLERSVYDGIRVGETIAPQAAQWLRRLGIPDALASVPHVPAPQVIRVWESPVPASDPLGFENERHGWHVDRARFDSMLSEEAERAGAVVRRGAMALACERTDDQWRLEIACAGRRVDVHAHWVIDATGRRSWLLRRLRVRPSSLDRLVGLLGYAGPRASASPALFVEATPLGWWYSAPLPGQRSVAAFMTDGDLIERDGRDLASFWEEQRARSALIARLHGSGASLRAVVARTARASTVAAHGWIAVGDAAAAFDPLFGLGVSHALASGWSGARAVLDARERGAAALASYDAWSASQFSDYVDRRDRIYGAVARFDSPFWQRRRATAPRA